MIKLTVLYGHPTDPAAFESYYANTHLPLVAKMKGFEKAELTKFLDEPDGGKAAHYRMANFGFQIQKHFKQPWVHQKGRLRQQTLLILQLAV